MPKTKLCLWGVLAIGFAAQIGLLKSEEPRPNPAAAPTAAAPTADEIKQWIKKLDDDSFAARDEATMKLIEAGKAGVSALREAMGSSSQETASRATDILRRLALSDDSNLAGAARAELEKSKRAEQPELAARAEEAIRSLTPDPPQAVMPNFRMRPGRWRPGGEIQLGPGAQLVLEGGLSHTVRISNVNGNKTIDVTENKRRLRIEEDANHENIRVTVTDVVDGKDAKTEVFEAKNREQLWQEHKEQCTIYDQYATDQQGMLNVQVRGAGNPARGLPFPNMLRAQLPLMPTERQKAADAAREARALLQQARKKLPQDRAADGWQEALDQLDAAEKKLNESLQKLEGDDIFSAIGQ